MPRQRSNPVTAQDPDIAIDQAMSAVEASDASASEEPLAKVKEDATDVLPIAAPAPEPVVVTVHDGGPVSRTFDLPPTLVRKVEEALLQERDKRPDKLTRNAIAIEAMRLWLREHNYPSDQEAV